MKNNSHFFIITPADFPQKANPVKLKKFYLPLKLRVSWLKRLIVGAGLKGIITRENAHTLINHSGLRHE